MIRRFHSQAAVPAGDRHQPQQERRTAGSGALRPAIVSLAPSGKLARAANPRRMKVQPILLIAATLLVGSCGRRAELVPAPGHTLPVKPMLARATPTFDELLTPPTQARPTRIDELVTRSKPRAADPFDLPQPTGGAAPPAPAASDPSTVPANGTPLPLGETPATAPRAREADVPGPGAGTR